ncbi:acyl-ACP--UDP-N-acetylglucosamine O-acyltransferase [Elioraea sp. Yellowstone]|jgi:UDP-N-acetylglucosamine acyltransferase|uniref:acyl-ACP--UDP-N-acetylglucosamine O-acyltransferase n=1 Tax=Elioraea sp. Yellowstone TaxID=2592070 RepID=UPI001151F5E3|nr:acyl-ACP--UDP-N-acetylglucosamine O-acyltransferase [Elioraea sp. Yellowstone]TQF79408.1 acyl-ACP--UDP-N-acetylglucosamine O-acyltransferase [Elioraea sp. Yellowstone]
MPEIHATAQVAPGARLAGSVRVGPFSVIGPDVALEEGVEIGAHVVIEGHTTLGPGVRVMPFATIGLPPQDLKYRGEPTRVEIGARTLVREHATIHRGSVGGGLTRIGADCMIMCVAHVAHDCELGDGVIVANNVMFGGHAKVGDNAYIGGGAAIHQFVRIGRNAAVGGMSGVEGDVIPFGLVMGNRARLTGLNLVGLKRRGFARAEINALRAAFRLLFRDENGTFALRVAEAARRHAGDALVQEVIAFMRMGGKRPLCRAAGPAELDLDDEAEANGAVETAA